MAEYNTGGPPPRNDMAGVRVLAPKRGLAIILGPPFTVFTHPLWVDVGKPSKQLRTRGCRKPHCQHCAAGHDPVWSAYFPAWAVEIANASGREARRCRFVLQVGVNCYEALLGHATLEDGIVWRGLQARFQRADAKPFSELRADYLGHVDEEEGAATLASSFPAQAVVLNAWGDTASMRQGAERDGAVIVPMKDTDAADSPDAEIAPRATAIDAVSERLARFRALPDQEQQRWVAEAGRRYRASDMPALLSQAARLWAESCSQVAG
jgi:hypothetical protein